MEADTKIPIWSCCSSSFLPCNINFFKRRVIDQNMNRMVKELDNAERELM